MGAEAKRYLQENSIPQLFEGLITGLIYNKPDDPISFLENAIAKIRQNPDLEYTWNLFVDDETFQKYEENQPDLKTPPPPPAVTKLKKRTKSRQTDTGSKSRERTTTTKSSSSVGVKKQTRAGTSQMSARPASVILEAAAADIPDVPIILFMGGPGGGKTRYAARVQAALTKFGLVHICMPDMIRAAITKYQDLYPEWKDAANRYQRGELIPNNLALALVKAEMGKHQDAKAFFLEGFPREARQVEDFEREVRPVNMAMILDYDEATLRRHMESRGLDVELIDARIREFKLKTLPSAKYFDDQRLLHLIPGEEDENWIFERMKKLIKKAMELGVPVTTSKVTSRVSSPQLQQAENQNVNVAAAAEPEPEPEPEPEQPRPQTKEAKNDEPKADSALKKDESVPPTKSSKRGKRGSMASKRGSGQQGSASSAGAPVENEKAERLNTAKALVIDSEAVAATEVHESPQLKESTIETVATIEPVPATLVERETKTAERAETDEPRTSENNSKQNKSSATSDASTKVVKDTANDTQQDGNVANEAEVKQHEDHEGDGGSRSSGVSTPTPATGIGAQLIRAADLSSKDGAPDERFPKGLPNNAPVILIVGAPGSNRKMISRRLAVKYDGFLLLSMGDLLRKEVEANKNDQLWQRLGKKLNAGEPVPMKICRDLLYSTLYGTAGKSWGYIIEGYPRTQSQATDFDNQVGRLDLAILIDCTEQYCMENIAKRRLSGEKRPEDAPETVKARLEFFKHNTLPMLKNLDDKGKLKVVRMTKVDGDTNIEGVFEEVVNVVDGTIFIEEKEGGKSLGSSKPSSPK